MEVRPSAVSVLNRLKKLGKKSYRDGYLETSVRGRIALQLRAIRKGLGLTQKQMSEKLEKPQSTIARLENMEYGKVTIQTLLDIGKKLDIALFVGYVSYPEFIRQQARSSDRELRVNDIHVSIKEHLNLDHVELPHSRKTSAEALTTRVVFLRSGQEPERHLMRPTTPIQAVEKNVVFSVGQGLNVGQSTEKKAALSS